MKEYIDKLARGVIEYERPILEVSTDRIAVELDVDDEVRGEFLIRSANGMALKGVAYSGCQCLSIVDPVFVGNTGRIEYIVSSKGLDDGTNLTGSINLVSDGGEISIPVMVDVAMKGAGYENQKIRNMFHFANFVQTNYDEALKLFVSQDFRRLLIGKDIELMSIYEGVMDNEDKAAAMEEFLISTNKKKRVNISLSEQKKIYDHPYETMRDSFIISKDNWGYVNLRAESDSDFIVLEKKKLDAQDFVGSNYEYTYFIKPERLHSGMNYGRITVSYNGVNSQQLSVDIIVDNTEKTDRRAYEYKKLIAQVYKLYMDFRLHKIDMDSWSQDTTAVLDKLRGLDERDYFPKLLQAQIFISTGRESEASWLLENVAETLLGKRDLEPEIYAYYLYVRTLQKRDRAFTDEMKKKVNDIFNNGHETWPILWVLLYMDDIYDNNISLKLARIKELYSYGMNSGIMYFEAACVLAQQPAMLRVLNDFEKQVVYFAAKNNIMTEKLAIQFAELAKKERGTNEFIIKILELLYDRYQNSNILSSIISIYIKNGYVGKPYLKWYQLGIDKEIKLAGIYENFLYSCDDTSFEPLPKHVLMYFNYNTDVVNDKLSYLYSNIIKNKDKQPDVYASYQRQIEKYAVAFMMAGRVNNHLAIIYKEIMSKALITEEMAEKLPAILCTQMLECREKNIRSVTVVYKELVDGHTAPVIGGVAYIPVYTEEPVYIFEDIYGNRYCKDIDYTVTKLFDGEQYLRLCYEIRQDNIYLAAHFADEFIRYRKNTSNAIEFLHTLLQLPEIRPQYKRLLEKEVIDYYMDNYDGDSLDEYLLQIDVEPMDNSMRNKVIELLILRNHYMKALEIVGNYGFVTIDPRRIMMLASRAVIKLDYEEADIVTRLSRFAFEKGKYDEIILGYLSKHFYGTTKEMLAIWEAENDFECSSRELEERLIGQMLFTGTYVSSIGKVYESYYEKGPSDKIKKAYLISKAYDYFVHDKIVDDRLFAHIDKELSHGENLADICRLAYIRFYSQGSEKGKFTEATAKNTIEYLCSKNIIFECYKRYKKYFNIPYVAEDKTIVEYRTAPEAKVYLNYAIETGSYEKRSFKTQQMKSIYPGVYTFEIVLFYGESLIYYINEERGSKSFITESMSLNISDRAIGENPSRYGMMNDIMICKELHEESTLSEVARNYYLQRKLTEEIYKLM